MLSETLNLLCCPNTKDSLEFNDGELRTDHHNYPILNNIPWMFRNPEEAFLEWGSKIQSYFKVEETILNNIYASNQQTESEFTKERIERILAARKMNVEDMYRRLNLFNQIEAIQIPPDTQQIHSYFNLIFRDWCSDNKELTKYSEYLNRIINNKDINVLILGSGAGGLSYKLVNANPKTHFISVEHNPYLAFLSESLFRGEKAYLTEYSHFPKNIAFTSHPHEIEVKKAHGKHQFIIASFPHLPIKEKSIDLVIAPWFFDILDLDFNESLCATTNYLKDDGELAIIGPANFHNKEIFAQLTADEINELTNKFFEESSFELDDVNYLHSDLASQQRIENLIFLHAKKPISNVKILKREKKADIKYTDGIIHFKSKIDTFHKILKHINSDMSLQDLANALESEFGFNKKESLHYAGIFYQMILKELN